jgi:hypothetical protein
MRAAGKVNGKDTHCKDTREGDDWKVAIRVQRDIEGPDITGSREREGVAELNDEMTPPVIVPMKDGDLYYMLDDFNHHHQVH